MKYIIEKKPSCLCAACGHRSHSDSFIAYVETDQGYKTTEINGPLTALARLLKARGELDGSDMAGVAIVFSEEFDALNEKEDDDNDSR